MSTRIERMKVQPTPRGKENSNKKPQLIACEINHITQNGKQVIQCLQTLDHECILKTNSNTTSKHSSFTYDFRHYSKKFKTPNCC
jgi:hypothetical protein